MLFINSDPKVIQLKSNSWQCIKIYSLHKVIFCKSLLACCRSSPDDRWPRDSLYTRVHQIRCYQVAYNKLSRILTYSNKFFENSAHRCIRWAYKIFRCRLDRWCINKTKTKVYKFLDFNLFRSKFKLFKIMFH